MKFCILYLVLLWISIAGNLLAQAPSLPQNFASPTAASLGVYGEIGVNYFTGSPNISVSLYEVNEGNIKIPIDLSYSTSLVKPNSHPGWNGLGFSMGCLGQITRVQKGDMDERISALNNDNMTGFYAGFAQLNWWGGNWNDVSTNFLIDVYNGGYSNNARYEFMGDEYVFSIPGGYSGKFQMGQDGKWHVFCDADIKVEFDENDGFISGLQYRHSISSQLQAASATLGFSDRYFNKFTLITPDGTRYSFGGINATEYSVSYRQQASSPVVPTTWFLNRITSISGQYIDFYYHEGSMICSLYRYSSYYRDSDSFNIWLWLQECSTTNFEGERKSGFLTFPVYLDSIKSSSETVIFEHSNSTELRYPDEDIRLGSSDDVKDGNYVFFIKDGDPLDRPKQLQWHKLDKIKIKYADHHLLKTFDFDYTHSEAERLKLISIQEKDKNGLAKPPYLFTYRPSSFLHYCSERVDHWGYNNAFDPWAEGYEGTNGFIDLYIKSKEPDTTGVFSQSELLHTIRYPTSGYTVFEFEPHTYSKQVNKDRISFSSLSKDKYAGGVRIKRISSYKDEHAQPLVKEYIYRSNYTGQQDLSVLSSSGVLGGLFEYLWVGYKGKSINNGAHSYDMFSTNSILPTASNAQGSHIGYSEVVELSSNNGYTKYTFTNYDTKVDDAYPHMDEKAVLNTYGDRTIYSAYTSKVMERGKLKKAESFNTYNQKVKEVSYGYTRSSDSFIRAIEIVDLKLCINSVFFGTAYKIYDYSYLLTSETEKTYPTDDPGNEEKALVNSKLYEYNMDRKLIKAAIQLQSDSSKIITYNNYPFDYNYTEDTTGTYLKSMASDQVHIISPVVEQKIMKQEKDGSVNLLGGIINSYGKNYLPVTSYRLELSNPSPSAFSSFQNHPPANNTRLIPSDLPYNKDKDFKYDQYGNVIEVKETGKPVVSYLWSYNHLLPVAIITNATNQEIAAALGYTSYFKMASEIGITYTDASKTKVNSLRTLIPKARVTTASYDPLIGITSVMNENGKSSYFEYDPFSRLQVIKDNDQNIIKAFRYNYKQ